MHSTTHWARSAAVVAACLAVAGCSSRGGAAAPGDASASGDGPGMVGPGSIDGSAPSNGVVVSQVDGGLGDTGLPPLPSLTNVLTTQREDSVGIDFDPVDNAVDYRVYVLPNPDAVLVNDGGSITIPNAIYRCAGLRQTFDLPNGTTNPQGVVPDGGQTYFNPNQEFSWGATILPNPILGYVYVQPATGLVPVYALGVHPTANELGWNESRPKIYTTSTTTRASLVASGARDDGIVFYVPSAAGPTTTTVYYSENVVQASATDTTYAEYFFTSADMASHTSDTTPPAPAFEILSATANGAEPLMAVFYQPGNNHTELAVGKERYNRAANQGPGRLWHLEWGGITADTTLVIEALATGCPFQGFLSPEALTAPPHQPLLTLAQLQQKSSTGEVYINGQYDLPGTTFTILVGDGTMGGMWAISDAGAPLLATPNSSPVPIARSFVQVSPMPHDPTAWDWYQGFTVGSEVPALAPVSDTVGCQCVPTGPELCVGGAGACGYFTSSLFDLGAYAMDDPGNVPLFAYGSFMGQLWEVFDDVYQDVGGELRMTAAQTATVSADQFLHVTWSVDIVGTHRRYPQMLVSDQMPPIEDSLSNPNSNTLLLQTFSASSTEPAFEAEAFHGLVNGKPWQVNNQAPNHWFINTDTWNANNPNATLQPVIPIFEHAGMDRMTRFDAYISSSLVYTFVDGTPAGCMQYPTSGGFALSGPVSITFGDVLYHESAPDEGICNQSHPYAFMHEHQCSESKRHWDDLGFKSGVAAPGWDNDLFPCQPY